MIRFEITSVEFSGGEDIRLESNSLTLLVGPNSSGKSTALADIQNALQEPQKTNRVVVRSANTHREGDSASFKKWLATHYQTTTRQFETHYVTTGHAIREKALDKDWQGQIKNLIVFLVHRLTTEERLQIVKPKQRVERQENPASYIHMLQADDDLLATVSREVHDSFGKDLIINWSGKQNVWFHVGVEPQRTKEADRVSSDYLDSLESLPRIEHEGDGLKSFVGCLLGVMCGAHKILLIDEPEAFLHPPQARTLGRILAETADNRHRQVVVATHSPDIVIGALTSSKPVSVCRIERSGDQNHAYRLDSRELADLWSKPLLQSTGAVNGIFHKGVVVCEADADCRFFEAVLTRLHNTGELTEAPDLYFIHGGGKGALDVLTRAYLSLNIRTVAVADFDVLHTRAEFQRILDACLGNFSAISADYSQAVSALNDLAPITNIRDFAERARELIDETQAKHELTSMTKKEFSQLLDQSAKWSDAKKYGINKLSGGAHQACQRVLDHCAEHGFFIIDTGELESFWRAGPASSKSEWIQKAIEELSSDPQSMPEADQFVRRICHYFGYLE